MTIRIVDNRLCRDGIPDYDSVLRCCGGADGVAYKTVAGAIAASVAGDVIKIREGTYREKYNYGQATPPLRQCCFYINKAVTIESWIGEIPILTYDPANPPLVDTSDWGAIVLVAQVTATLRGLTIIGTRALGDLPSADTDVNVLVQNNSTVTIENCAIQEFGHCGVKAGAAAVLIDSCVISDGGFTGRDHGVYYGTPPATGRSIIRNTEIARCAGYGVHLYGTPKDVNLFDCHIHHNGGTYMPANGGGVLIGGPGCLVEDCTIEDNTGYGGLVLWKATSAGGAYLRNTIINNTPNNITLDQAVAPNVVYQNTRHAAIWTNTNLAAWPDDGTDVIV